MWLFLIAVGLIGGGYALARRQSATLPPGPAPEPVVVWLLEVEVPAGQPHCHAVGAMRPGRFVKNDAPLLPLPSCDIPERCRCRFRSVAERRIGPRRSGEERRQAIRFDPDKPPRRRGPGRRRQDKVGKSWWG